MKRFSVIIGQCWIAILCVGVHFLILLSLIGMTLEVIIFMGGGIWQITLYIYTVIQKN